MILKEILFESRIYIYNIRLNGEFFHFRIKFFYEKHCLSTQRRLVSVGSKSVSVRRFSSVTRVYCIYGLTPVSPLNRQNIDSNWIFSSGECGDPS